ncbi:hypothetical protein [Bacteroides oleiciplenus]|uniref:Uncharacterized protein n=1 Tax=Bacteroides oleiciplenus YIT 12058 TaxID=742727 RepID=K9E2K5_9BACE|nr:hypothetical protein [Bacteroides oleiciplenus]EKU89926.1 hypothetical protein HMPREF9447_03364 [Bacteroides oleiciplenus YIT 12058]
MKVQIMKLSLLWGLIALCGGLLGCEDRVDDVAPSVDEDGLVPVSLSFGFADEMGSYTPVPGSPRRRHCLLRGEPNAQHQHTKHQLCCTGQLVQS